MLSLQKCEHRIGIYHLLQYRIATQDIEKHYNVIKQYNIKTRSKIVIYRHKQYSVIKYY